MVLRTSSIIQTYTFPQMRATASGKQMVFVNGFIRQMKGEESPLWIAIVLCPDRFGKLISILRPKMKLWVSGILLVESFMAKDCSSVIVKYKLIAEGVDVVSWGQSRERKTQDREQEPEPEPEPEPSEDSDPELFPF